MLPLSIVMNSAGIHPRIAIYFTQQHNSKNNCVTIKGYLQVILLHISVKIFFSKIETKPSRKNRSKCAKPYSTRSKNKHDFFFVTDVTLRHIVFTKFLRPFSLSANSFWFTYTYHSEKLTYMRPGCKFGFDSNGGKFKIIQSEQKISTATVFSIAST